MIACALKAQILVHSVLQVVHSKYGLGCSLDKRSPSSRGSNQKTFSKPSSSVTIPSPKRKDSPTSRTIIKKPAIAVQQVLDGESDGSTGIRSPPRSHLSSSRTGTESHIGISEIPPTPQSSKLSSPNPTPSPRLPSHTLPPPPPPPVHSNSVPPSRSPRPEPRTQLPVASSSGRKHSPPRPAVPPRPPPHASVLHSTPPNSPPSGSSTAFVPPPPPPPLLLPTRDRDAPNVLSPERADVDTASSSTSNLTGVNLWLAPPSPARSPYGKEREGSGEASSVGSSPRSNDSELPLVDRRPRTGSDAGRNASSSGGLGVDSTGRLGRRSSQERAPREPFGVSSRRAEKARLTIPPSSSTSSLNTSGSTGYSSVVYSPPPVPSGPSSSSGPTTTPSPPTTRTVIHGPSESERESSGKEKGKAPLLGATRADFAESPSVNNPRGGDEDEEDGDIPNARLDELLARNEGNLGRRGV